MKLKNKRKSGRTLYAPPVPISLPSDPPLAYPLTFAAFSTSGGCAVVARDVQPCRRVAAFLAVPFHVTAVSWRTVCGRRSGGGQLVVLMGIFPYETCDISDH